MATMGIVFAVVCLGDVRADVVYQVAKDAAGKSLYRDDIVAQGGVLHWSIDLAILDKQQKIIIHFEGEPMSRQSRSAVITHGTRRISDRIKRYLAQHDANRDAVKREQVNQAQDFLEKTLRDILDAPRMADIKAKEDPRRRNRQGQDQSPIHVSVEIFDQGLTVIHHDGGDQRYHTPLPEEAVHAFILEMVDDESLGAYVTPLSPTSQE